MATPTNLRVDELDFETIKENLKLFLKQQDQFLDVNFDASGINILLDVLAYNTYYNATYLNLAATENFLATAQRRNSVVNLARSLNYTPRSRSSAKIYGTITLTATGSPTNVELPTYTRFEGTVDGTTYAFVTPEPVTLFNTTGSTYQETEVELVQGRFASERYVVDLNNPDQRFLINNSNVDTSTIRVRIQTSASDTTTRVFFNPDNVVEVTGTTLAYFLEEVEDGKFELIFGDNVVGRALDAGNIVYIDYIVSDGADANGISNLTLVSTVSGVTNATWVADDPAAGGEERESIERVRFNAPKFYAAQNRTVTTEDFLSLILRQPNVGSAAVWGGEDNDPPQYGRVFIAIRPTTGTALTQFEKTAIIDTVIKPKKILTVQTEIIDPEFIFLTVTANIKFDPRLTTVTGESLRSSVIETIKKYNDDDLDQFSKYFRYSKLTKLIDNTERSILNNSITVRLRQEIPIQLGVGTRYEINFSNPINSVTRGRPATFPFGIVSQISTNGFTFQGLPNCFLEENNGIIRVFRIVRTDIVGVAQNIGTIDYTTGKIILTNFAPNAFADGGTTLRITAVPSELDILPLRGQILTIQDTDITVNITDDTQISLVRR
jgi:hypothetical protein